MRVTAIFKGGSMDGTEIAYESGQVPNDDESIFVNSKRTESKSIDFWPFSVCEVYRYSQSLHSWVYDHEHEAVNEE